MVSKINWKGVVLNQDSKIRDAAKNLNKSSLKIVLLIDASGKFVGTISDGDIRRALLKGENLDSPLNKIINRNPLTVTSKVDIKEIRKIMKFNKIHQIPILNDNLELEGLHNWDDFQYEITSNNLMVVMAGGLGSRMKSLTKECPKPMLKINEKPILQHLIERAKAYGVTNFMISINYLGEMIEEYFGDGRAFGVNIEYIRENKPLGTAGSLSLIQKEIKEPFFVTNGDVITNLDYLDLLDFHIRYKAIATMSVRLQKIENPYGVVDLDGVKFKSFHEKPIIENHINSGIYVLSPEALELMPINQRYDMPSLFIDLKNIGKNVIAFPMHEPWLDIGKSEDLENANIINF